GVWDPLVQTSALSRETKSTSNPISFRCQGRSTGRTENRRVAGSTPAWRTDPVVCENSGQGLRGLAVVELEHAAEPLTAFHRACSEDRCPGRDELVAEALVRRFLMVMVHELANGSPEVLLAERDDSLQTLGLGGQDEPFRIGVEVRTPGWQKQWL